MVGNLLIILMLYLLPSNAATTAANPYQLSWEEMKLLNKHEQVGGKLKDKLHYILNNEIYSNDKHQPHKIKSSRRGNQYIRASHWNIERGLHLEQIKKIVSIPEVYIARETDFAINHSDFNRLQEEINIFRDSDILTLNEVDIGLQRTGYKNIAAEIASVMNANYVFATEFIEVDDGLLFHEGLEKEKLKSLHGNAIISKFPIKSSRIIRLPQCYDWFTREQERLSATEKLRRSSSKALIHEEITTEVRRGSRVAIVADLKLPNGKTITAVSTHLENRCEPKCREKQMQYLLDHLKMELNPIILGADMNNFEKSAEPTSVGRIIGKRVKDPLFLTKSVLSYLNPYALATNVSSAAVGLVRKHKDPTKANIPIILPNKSKKLFKIIENFEFEDDNYFDFSGDRNLSYHHDNDELGNSNQRESKGFTETYSFNRAFGLAHYKIDWLFVKPLRHYGACDEDFEDLGPNCKSYYPAFGRTLKILNESYLGGKLSDHNPVSVKVIL